jgi:ATP-dependent RNA helicase DeaD
MTDPVPAPPTFDALPLSPDLKKALDVMEYRHPTPVQLAVFDPAVRGKNLVVQARTGTGKTTAFGLPILDQLIRKSLPKVQALVLCPTRELALQVSRELEKLAQFRGTKIVAIYGGAPIGKQVEALEAGAQMVVGTPGRVLDHLRRKTLDPSNVRIFVLDEADEMLSMGFAKELYAIAETLPKERQGLFFSATIPPDIERLAVAQLKDPEFITLSSDQIGALEVDHFVYIVRGGDKRQQLLRVLEVEDPEGAIIFCNTKNETERLAALLQDKGYDADWLNGDLAQNDRERVMARTREGKLRFLVATDVAARGIDISHLTHVINADFPESAEYYVHRTGRTGRAGRTGTAISMVGPKDIGSLYLLRLTYKIRPIEKQLPTEGEVKTRAEQDIVELFEEAFSLRPAHPDDLALARRLMTHYDAEKIIAGLLRDHLGARPIDPATEAADARRARNPAPMSPLEPVPELRAVASSPAKVVAPSSSFAAPAPPPAIAAPEVKDRGREAEWRAPRPREDASEPRVGGAPRRELRGRGPRDAAAPAREARPRRDPRGAGAGGVPHKSFTSWEPPEESDDDKPIMGGGAVPVAPISEPKFTVSDAPFDAAAAAPSRPSRESKPDVARVAPPPRERGRDRDREREPDAIELPDDPSFVQIFVNVGRRDGARAGDIQDLLEKSGSMALGETGRIRVRDRMTFVSVKRELFEKAIAALAGQVIGGRNVVAELAKPRP